MANKRSTVKRFMFFILLLITHATLSAQANLNTDLKIVFNEEDEKFTEVQKEFIITSITESENKLRELLPKLPKEITVFIQITNNDFKTNGGVNGRAERNSPAEVIIEISSSFPGGLTNAIQTGLIPVIYHEFHHLSRGWAIQDNKHDTQIYIAAVNEGLAVVFSEVYTGVMLPWNEYPDNVEQWVTEITLLPKNSNYRTWMFQHPDGRTGIGYKAGNFIIRKAMTNSGKDILQLSKLSHRKILKLAGYKY